MTFSIRFKPYSFHFIAMRNQIEGAIRECEFLFIQQQLKQKFVIY